MDQPIANRFCITSAIGAGGMGQVYAGIDTHTSLPVAIKRLRVDALVHDPKAVTRFQREGEILRQLDHPNIVNILAVVEDSDQPCIVMELVDGGSLADAIKNSGPLSVERTLGVALELADALARAHHLEIIHRDIKPQNVLLADDGTPRLTDFGLAQRADMPALTATQTVVGTLDYLSPEALNGEPLDTRTDIWSFGVMLFEMLAGLRPFRGHTMTATLKSILTEPPMPDLERLRPDISEPLAALIYTMLEKDRARRLDSMRRVAILLEDIKKGKSPAVLTSRLARRHPSAEIPTRRHNLPEAATPFIGREEEIQSLAADLGQADCRLLSLVGPGGIGKTRLALEVAAQYLDDYDDGVFTVELSAVHSVDDIPTAIRAAVGFQFSRGGDYSQRQWGDAQSELLDYLRSKELLLVLDNFEHLLDGIDIIDAILTTAPHVKIIATSREVLHLDWEWVYTVRGLEVPEDDQATDMEHYSAIRLFTTRAKCVQPRFSLDAERECAVHICRLVDGMPLGIELAASWLRMLTCQELVDEISQNLDVLTSRQRTGSERHRSLRAVFDHSWTLLSIVEQEALLQLSIFSASFRRESAREVANASLAVLSALVDKSLLRVDGAGWYDLHPLLQQYVVEKLSNLSEIEKSARDRHALYYLNFMEERSERIHGADSPAACTEIEAEFENIKAAFKRACQQGDSQHLEPAVLTLQAYLSSFAIVRGVTLFLRELIDLWVGPKELVYATLVAIYVNYSFYTDYTDELPDILDRQALFEECRVLLERSGDDPNTALAYLQLAWCEGIIIDRSVKRELNLEALRRFESLDQTWGILRCYGQQAMFAVQEGKWDLASHQFQRVLKIATETACPHMIASAYRRNGWSLYRVGDVEAAHDHTDIAHRMFKALGDKTATVLTGIEKGMILLDLGRLDEAHAIYVAVMPIATNVGHRWLVADLHNSLGLLLVKKGDYREARYHLESAVALDTEIGGRYGSSDSLGELELRLGNLSAAQKLFHVGLANTVKIGVIWLEVFMTNQFARLCARLGDLERSAELLGFAINHPAAESEMRGHADALLEELQAEMDQDVLQAAMERGKQRELEDVVAELLEDFASDGI